SDSPSWAVQRDQRMARAKAVSPYGSSTCAAPRKRCTGAGVTPVHHRPGASHRPDLQTAEPPRDGAGVTFLIHRDSAVTPPRYVWCEGGHGTMARPVIGALHGRRT